MRGHARGRLGAAAGPPPRGPWVPGRARLRGLLRRLLSPLRCPPPTRPPPTRPPPSRAGSPLGGLSAGGLSAALSRRFVSAPRRALPRPLGPRSGGSGRGRGYAPAAGVFLLFARHSAGRLAGGIPAGAFACGSVGGGVPRPFAAARRPCAPRKICLACLRSCLRWPPPRPSVCRRAPAGRLGAGAPCPRGRHRRARGYRRGAPCRPYARKAPATRGERSRLSPLFLCALRARLRVGRVSRALAPTWARSGGCAGCAALAGPSLPSPRGAPFGCLRRVRSVPKGPSAARPSARWAANERPCTLASGLNYLNTS